MLRGETALSVWRLTNANSAAAGTMVIRESMMCGLRNRYQTKSRGAAADTAPMRMKIGGFLEDAVPFANACARDKRSIASKFASCAASIVCSGA